MAIDAGIVSAYGFAVAHGYTGTPEQFGEDQANFAVNAQQVREDKEDVEDLKDEVQDLVDTIPPDYTTTVEKVDTVTDVIGNLFSDSEAMGGATGITRASASEYVGTASAFQTFLLNNYTLDENAEAYTIAFDIYTEANSSSSGTGLEVQYGNHSSKSTLTSFDNDQTEPYHFESFFSVTYAPTVADRTLGLVFKANSAPNNIWHVSNIRLFEGSEIPDAVTAKDIDAREKVDEAVKDLEDLKSSFDEFESDSNNLWVNFFGVYNGVTFAPNGRGGIKITGTATATGLFEYQYPVALELDGMRLQYKQTGINNSGQLYIYCRNASNTIQRELQITAGSGYSVDSPHRSVKKIQLVVISGVEYNAEIYISLTETTAETKLYPPKIVNAYYAKYADFLGEPTVDIDFWGDSLTQGYGGDGVTFPNVCATIMGASYRNNGHGGETANTIAARQGGNAWIIPAGDVNGDYTLANMNDVFGGKVTPLRQIAGDTTSRTIYVNGIACTLVRKSQTSPASDDIVYTVSGYTGSALKVPTPCRFYGSDYNAKVTVIFVGTNGQTVGDITDVNARITIIDSMIEHLKAKNYIIMGLSNGNDSTRNADDAAMLAHYGNNFFPTRRELVNNGLTIMNITPTENDIAYISSGTVPESLRIDATHLNANGYNALGLLLAYKMYSLGYDKLIAT